MHAGVSKPMNVRGGEAVIGGLGISPPSSNGWRTPCAKGNWFRVAQVHICQSASPFFCPRRSHRAFARDVSRGALGCPFVGSGLLREVT